MSEGAYEMSFQPVSYTHLVPASEDVLSGERVAGELEVSSRQIRILKQM